MKFLVATSPNTADNIFSRQNDEFLLQCQVAQRSEYSYAKKLARRKTIFTMGFAGVSIAASALNFDWLSALSSLIAVFLIVFNKYSDVCIKSHKKHAASIQQYVDVTLYSTVLDVNESEWGEVPNKTDLANTVSEFACADTSEMKNWYSDYSSLSGEAQVFHCQSENVRWDYSLHKAIRLLQLAVFVIVAVAMLTIFFVANPDFIKLLCILSWLTPIVEYSYSAYKEVSESIALLQALDKFCEGVEKKLSTGSPRTIKRELIRLQYKIRERRELGYLIPDWFYQMHKKRQQEKEDKIAETIVHLSKKSGE